MFNIYQYYKGDGLIV
ncbi:hypothetical protein F383_26486 [Gossypium arboreum]|uniref:Uncharacterized protein n=1 Tax=Gossypium arboreum TaxID=29729 RepID=A0A0B0PBZ6_GOSAR|nr:hypothetical protein F383_26486 [Gossypium arboreum]